MTGLCMVTRLRRQACATGHLVGGLGAGQVGQAQAVRGDQGLADGTRLRECAVPEQVEVAGELGGAVHDAGDLADDHGAGAGVVQRPEEGERVEADRAVRGERAGDIVCSLRPTLAGRAVTGGVLSAPDGLTEARETVVCHLTHLTRADLNQRTIPFVSVRRRAPLRDQLLPQARAPTSRLTGQRRCHGRCQQP
jgi:hypothetical protein